MKVREGREKSMDRETGRKNSGRYKRTGKRKKRVQETEEKKAKKKEWCM